MKNQIKKFLHIYKQSGLIVAVKKLVMYLNSSYLEDISRFKFNSSEEITEDIKYKYKYEGDLVHIFANNKKNIVHKWHHYIPVYDKYLSMYRDKKIKILEIGVSKGGSLQMWRTYFGDEAIIFGIDIDQNCKNYDNIAGNVRIGSQDDESFLISVIDEMDGVDIIIDDGSHMMDHIRKSFKYLFPKLNDSGLYIVEDLHAAYWPGYGGGLRSTNNFFNLIRDITDDMHHWYHGNNFKIKEVGNSCSSIHIYDSIVVFEKNKGISPVHSEVL